ncbi:MAG: tRNA dihydrouridine synthase DusB [Erysipelothrix sp.]|nr:tRNA dihydrouridine synthase DusB [Erysipelothrix sp.]
MTKSIKIGNVQLNNQVILAPMAGVSNQSFRRIAKEFGVSLVCSEMVSDQAINFRNEKTLEMLKVSEDERPISMQLFGSDKESIIKAAIFLDKETDCDIIDFNFGCPVGKIVNNGAGSALMKDPNKAFEIMKAIVENVNKPVTAKFRSGWDLNNINAVDFAVLMEKAGADALTIHPRTKTQMYTGHSDWSLIKAVKDAVSIPVIGSGDIKSYADAKKMLEETGCDAVMIGRAAFGNPWLLKQVVDGLAGHVVEDNINNTEIYTYIIKHMESLKSLKGEKIASREMRGHIAWYISGLAYNRRIKDIINQVESYSLMLEVLKTYFDILNLNEDELIKPLVEKLFDMYIDNHK